jgi:cytochrome d ubiquinol oxidase subunit II
MDITALLLSRLQFAFTVSLHIIFPSSTIGLAAWLTVLECLHLATGRSAYRVLFEFWLKIFGVAFGFGVVSGIVMAFELGTNWSELSRMSGPIQGPLLAYQSFTAYRLIPSAALLVFLVVELAYALAEDLPVMTRWLDRPSLLVFPVVGASAAITLGASVHRHDDALPFLMVAVLFVAAFGTLAISFWPYIIPFSIKIEQAAASHASLAFMFWGAGLFVFPLMLLYTVISLTVFRGKFTTSADHY